MSSATSSELTTFLKKYDYDEEFVPILNAHGINTLAELDAATDDFLTSIGIPIIAREIFFDFFFNKFINECHLTKFGPILKANGINTIAELDAATDAFLTGIGIPPVPLRVFRENLLQRKLRLAKPTLAASANSSAGPVFKYKSPDALSKLVQKTFSRHADVIEDKLRASGITSVDELYAAPRSFLERAGLAEFDIRKILSLVAASSAAASSAASSSASSSAAAKPKSPDALAKFLWKYFTKDAHEYDAKLRVQGINSVDKLYAAPRSFLERVGIKEFDIRKILSLAAAAKSSAASSSSSAASSSSLANLRPPSPGHSSRHHSPPGSPGSPRTRKRPKSPRSPRSPRDCIKEFRHSAKGYIESDVESQFEIVSLQPNPHAAAGTPLSNNFCDQLDALRDAVSKGLKVPNQVVILAYHGTDLRTVGLILRSHVKQGDRNMYGKGAYFTTDINIAEYFSLQRPTVRGTFYVIVSALILKPDSYTFEPPNARHPRDQQERPLSYIVNNDVQVQLPLFSMELRRKGPKRKAFGTEIVFEGPYSRISGNSSTNTRNVDFGGTRKKRKPKHTVLFMTLDGKVGVKKT